MTSAEQARADNPDGKWVERRVVVRNPLGFHVRPAQKLAAVASKFEAQVVLRLHGQDVNAKSLVHLMVLSAVKGTPFTIRACGGDAAEAVAAIVALFKDGFGEMHPKESE